MRCRTEGCSGKYVPIKMVCEGLGGAIVIEIASYPEMVVHALDMTRDLV